MQQLMVLGICGSPRFGNSEFLLKEALKAAEEVDPSVKCLSYSIRAKKMGPCLGCGRCGDLGGECVFRDDFQTLRDLWLQADVVIYSVPVYHMGIPGQLKCFIDRLGNSMFARYRPLFTEDKLPKLLKVVGGIAQGIHMCSGQEHTLTDLINHALLMGCVPVTGDMWESYIGGGGWTSNDVDRHALEKQVGEGQMDASIAVKSSRAVARRAVELAMILRAGGQLIGGRLAKDPVYQPFVEKIGLEAGVSR